MIDTMFPQVYFRGQLRAEGVKTLEQAYLISRIRNTGRHEMTNDTSFITREMQKIWWEANGDTVRAWIYYLGKQDIGFSMIRGKIATLCVWPRFRGQGIGSAIYQHLKEESGGDIWIEVKKSNSASVKAAINAGYHVIAEKPETWTLTPYD